MPPIRKFTKEKIIEVAKKITEQEGFHALNARRIAKELNSSVQPIFHNFSSMDELKESVYEEIYQIYQSYMKEGLTKEKPYKQLGLSYIKFARDYPEYFKLIFMQKTDLDINSFMMADHMGKNVIKLGQNLTGFDQENQKKFHLKVWVFTHGIACLAATKTIQITEQEVEELLENTVLELLEGYELRKGKKNEKCN